MADEGDRAAGPLRSEATGLLAPGDEPPHPHHRTRLNPVQGFLEASLLGFAAAVPISLAASQILLGLFVVFWIVAWRRKAIGGPFSRLTLLALVFIFAGEILAALINGTPGHVIDPFLKHGVLIALPALAAVAASRPIFYRRVVGLAAAAGVVVAFYAIWQHFRGIDVLRDRALEPYGDNVFVATGTFGHHLTYGGSVMLLLLAAVGLAAGLKAWRSPPVLLVPPLALGLLWSYARSAWGGAASGLLALLLPRRGRRALILAAISGIAVIGALVIDPSVRLRVEDAFQWRGMPPRLRLWQASLRMLADHPWGIGPGRFEELFPYYWTPGRIHSTVHAHCDLLRAALDGGPLGLAGYFLLVGGSILGATRTLRRVDRVRASLDADPHSNPAAERDLIAIALAASTAFAVAGIFQTYFWDQEDVMLWVLLAAPALGRRHG